MRCESLLESRGAARETIHFAATVRRRQRSSSMESPICFEGRVSAIKMRDPSTRLKASVFFAVVTHSTKT